MVDVPARMSAEGQVFPAQVRDICRDAVLVECHVSLALESLVGLTLELPACEGPLSVTGKVIRVVKGEGDARRIAVLFTDVTPAAATGIDFFLALQE